MKKQKKQCSITAMITLIVLTHTIANGMMLMGMIVYGFSSLTPARTEAVRAGGPLPLSEGEGSKAGITEIHVMDTMPVGPLSPSPSERAGVRPNERLNNNLTIEQLNK